MSDHPTDVVNTTEPEVPSVALEQEASSVPQAQADAAETNEAEQPDAVESESEAAESAADQEETADNEDRKQKRKSWRERVDRLTAQKHQLAAERDAARAELDRLRQRQQEFYGDNDDDLDFDQMQAREVRKALNEERQADAEAQAAAAEQRAASARYAMFMTRVEAASERIPGLEQSLAEFERLPVNESTADFLAESEVGPEMMHFLARNPRVASDINHLDPFRAGQVLARLEGQIRSAPQTRKVSKAPPPPKTVAANPAAGMKDPSSMSQSEYNAWRRKQVV